jgi:hypothetical protein
MRSRAMGTGGGEDRNEEWYKEIWIAEMELQNGH